MKDGIKIESQDRTHEDVKKKETVNWISVKLSLVRANPFPRDRLQTRLFASFCFSFFLFYWVLSLFIFFKCYLLS